MFISTFNLRYREKNGPIWSSHNFKSCYTCVITDAVCLRPSSSSSSSSSNQVMTRIMKHYFDFQTCSHRSHASKASWGLVNYVAPIQAWTYAGAQQQREPSWLLSLNTGGAASTTFIYRYASLNDGDTFWEMRR